MSFGSALDLKEQVRQAVDIVGNLWTAAEGKQSVDLSNLAPGKYIFYCTVPGHREAGMEGNLTVTGGPTP